MNTSKKGEKIAKHIKAGKGFAEILAMGHNRETIKYHIRKIRYPKRYRKFVHKISILNSKRLDKLSKKISSKK